MTRINAIQQAIISLDGGGFQKLVDAYLYKKYHFENIQPLGVETTTDKVTKGTPDSFVKHKDDTYTLILYGTVKAQPFRKIKEDILSCFDKNKLEIKERNIKKLICAHTSTNLHIEQQEELENLKSGINIELLGIGTISHDILVHFPTLASDFLSLPFDTEQIYTVTEFIKRYDQNGMNAPLNLDFKYRSDELDELSHSVESSKITLITGQSGVGKTKLAIEVCKEFEQKGFRVLCIKNNGLSIFEDIRFYFSNPGNYLLFIDDANQTSNLEYILDKVISPPEGINIKIIATVRDYANGQLTNLIRKYTQFQTISIDPFDHNEIKTILKDCLGIINNIYLDRIAKISNGNPRLAILAGISATDNGYKGINNASDIFKNYYGNILNTQELQDSMIKLLFIISLLGPFNIDENDLALKLITYFQIDEVQLLNILHELNEKELIDLYQDKVVKVSDQSFANYILEFSLLERKIINIETLLRIGFPKYKKKLIYAINTILELFPDENAEKYIRSQINKSWQEADSYIQDEYLQCFYKLNEEKSLQLIKNTVDKMDKTILDLENLNFEKKKNNHSIEDNYIRILSGFRNSIYYQDAVELLIYFFDKRPDLIMDFYFAIIDNFSFDQYSHKYDYNKEFQFVDTVKILHNNYQSDKLDFLLIHVFSEMLKCNFHKTEPGKNNKSVNMINFSLLYTEGSKRLRRYIWELLSQIYSNGKFQNDIHNVISEYHGPTFIEEDFQSLFEYDLECIKELFVDRWEELSFNQCKVLRQIVDFAAQFDISLDEDFYQYKMNKDFNLYDIFSTSYYKKSLEDIEKMEKRSIEELINNYDVMDFNHLFEVFKDLESNNQKNNWQIAQNFVHLFDIIKNRTDYLDIVDLFLSNNAPYSTVINTSIINSLIEKIGVYHTKDLIESHEFDYQSVWLCSLWESIPESMVNQAHVDSLKKYIIKEKDNKYPIFPRIIKLKKYYKFDNNVPIILAKEALYLSESFPYIISHIVHGIHDDSHYELILKMFNGERELLEDIYLKSSDRSFDYKGIILDFLIKENIVFFELYLKEIAEVGENDRNSRIFQRIWLFDDYSLYINIAYDTLLKDYYEYVRDNELNLIFPTENKLAHKDVHERKISWIKKHIQNNHSNISALKKIYYIINQSFKSEKFELTLEFFNYSKDIDVFKEIPIVSSSYMFSGSEVPVLDNQIQFIEKLINKLSGLQYIEHRAYLKEQMTHLEVYREHVQIREHLDYDDYL